MRKKLAWLALALLLAEAHGIEFFLYKPVSAPMLLTLVERLTARTHAAVA